jgi:CBS domain-containing protein
MPTVNDILTAKGRSLHTISPETDVLTATRKMNEFQVGALVVEDAARQIAGIFTERDVLRRVVAEQRDPAEVTVGQVMTPQVVCIEPTTDLGEVQQVMKTRRIRHLPVVEDGKLLGMISIGDVNGFFARDGQVQVHFLSEYIYGRS